MEFIPRYYYYFLQKKEFSMSQAKDGDNVSVHYTGKRHDGSVFDSSVDTEPVVFTLGEGQLIDGFEEAIMGMAIGERKTVTIPPVKAYGERQEEWVVSVPKAEFPESIEPSVGMELHLTDEDDQDIEVLVKEVTEDAIILDGNPPLAGETLTFDLELVAIA